MKSIYFRDTLFVGIFFLAMIVLPSAFGYENLIVSREETKRAVAEKLAKEISENWKDTLDEKFENLKGCSTYVPNNWAHKTHYFYIDRLPPSFNVGFHKSEIPLSINSNEILFTEFAEGTNSISVSLDEPVQIMVKVFEESGAENVRIFSLSLNHNGTDLVNNPPDTFITWNSQLVFDQIPKTKGVGDIIELVEVNDPKELFSNAEVTASRDGHKLELFFEIEFAKPMKKSNLLLFASDRIGNPMFCNVFNILEVDSYQQSFPKENFSFNELENNCKKPLIQATKLSNGEQICIKSSTAEILLERNWIANQGMITKDPK